MDHITFYSLLFLWILQLLSHAGKKGFDSLVDHLDNCQIQKPFDFFGIIAAWLDLIKFFLLFRFLLLFLLFADVAANFSCFFRLWVLLLLNLLTVLLLFLGSIFLLILLFSIH